MMMKGMTRHCGGVGPVLARAKRGRVLPTVGRSPSGTTLGLGCSVERLGSGLPVSTGLGCHCRWVGLDGGMTWMMRWTARMGGPLSMNGLEGVREVPLRLSGLADDDVGRR